MATPKIRESTLQAGYLPFYSGLWNSDHRGIFVDLSIQALFHGDTPTLTPMTSRYLSSQNKSQVDKFTKALTKQQCLPEILQHLRTLARIDEWTNDHHAKFDTIDKEFTRSLLKAEKKCKMPHDAQWHPQLHQRYLIHKYWKTSVQSKRNHKHTTDQLISILHQIKQQQYDHLQDNPHRPPIYQLKLAKKNLQEARQHDITRRQNHLTYRQEILVLEG
jgi:hypothetical protein